jgi:hypothetical protein
LPQDKFAQFGEKLINEPNRIAFHIKVKSKRITTIIKCRHKSFINFKELNTLISEADPVSLMKYKSNGKLKADLVQISIREADKVPQNEFVTIAKFLFKNGFGKLAKSENIFLEKLNKQIAEFETSNILEMLKGLKKSTAILKHDEFKLALLNEIRNRSTTMTDYQDIISSMYAFQDDNEVMLQLDTCLVAITDSLKEHQWIDILKVKSILRKRNRLILELCAFNIVNIPHNRLTLGDIQQCLLSCGILTLVNNELYKSLIENLSDKLDDFIKNPSQFVSDVESTNNLKSIINSLGMLQILDVQLLNKLTRLLSDEYFKNHDDLLISFIITCATLNYKTKSFEDIAFKKVIHNIRPIDKITNIDSKVLLNYVWSMCCLNKVEQNMIEYVLNRQFSMAMTSGYF